LSHLRELGVEKRRKKEETTAVKYKPFGVAMPCGLTMATSLIFIKVGC